MKKEAGKKITERENFIVIMLILFFPVGLYFMWKNAEWKTGGKIAITIICSLILIVGLSPSDEETKGDDVNQEETQSEPTYDEQEDIADESESVESDVEETETVIDDELSDEFANNAGNYLLQLSDSYTVLGDLESAQTESEMKAIIKEAQSEYDLTNEYYTALEPQNDREQAIYDKITDIDALASSALINAEDGLDTGDVNLINQATEDIEESGVIAESIEEDFNQGGNEYE